MGHFKVQIISNLEEKHPFIDREIVCEERAKKNWAMPERKQFFLWEVFPYPKCLHLKYLLGSSCTFVLL